MLKTLITGGVCEVNKQMASLLMAVVMLFSVVFAGTIPVSAETTAIEETAATEATTATEETVGELTLKVVPPIYIDFPAALCTYTSA